MLASRNFESWTSFADNNRRICGAKTFLIWSKIKIILKKPVRYTAPSFITPLEGNYIFFLKKSRNENIKKWKVTEQGVCWLFLVNFHCHIKILWDFYCAEIGLQLKSRQVAVTTKYSWNSRHFRASSGYYFFSPFTFSFLRT